jgi:YVTN family beta-propeller protein
MKKISINSQLKVGLTLSCCLLGVTASAQGELSKDISYQAGGEILIGGQGGWDDLNVDPISHRLFVSHSDRVVVIDTNKDAVITEIRDTPGVHGIAIAHDLKKAFSSNGKENKVSVINLETLATQSKIQVGENPDAIVYEPSNQEVYAFNGRSHSVSVIDAKSEKVTTTISLPGKPEFAAIDPVVHRVFVNIEDKNSIVAIDTKTHQVAATWILEGCESPSGLAIDPKNHRLFSACENQKMVMVDSETGRMITSMPTGEGTDGAAFDSSLGLVFSPNGKSGTITIAREKSPDQLVVIQTLKSRVGARTMTLSPADHRIYLPTAEFQPAVKGARLKPVDGSQKVLVFAPKGDGL